MTQIKLRRDTAANFTSANPVLGAGEPAYETDTKKLKIGDGTTAYTQLEYFSAGGGSSTDISATLPLKIVDGVISLEVDGQTIQIVDGKLHANLDELGNKVNSLTGEVTDLSGRVTTVESEVANKQDKLNIKSPLKIDTVVDERMVGFSVESSTGMMRADSSQPEVMSFGEGKKNTITTSSVQAYIKIPYTVGQVIRLPFKPTSTYSTGRVSLGTAMIAGWYGHTEDDGSVTPIFTFSLRATANSSSYDTPSTTAFYKFTNNGTGLWTANKSKNGAHFPGSVTGTSDMPVLYTQVTYHADSSTTIFDVQFPSHGYKNPDYTTYWTAGFDMPSTDILNSIDCFIYCPPGQENINQQLFGLFNANGRLGPSMLSTITNNNLENLFSFENADINYLQLDIGDGLSVVGGKLTASPTAPSNMVTTDTAQEITGSKLFSNGLKVGGYAGISDNNGEQFIRVDPSHNGWTIGCQNSGGWFSNVHIKRGASGDYINIDSGNISDYIPTATSSSKGIVKPDGTSITVSSDGTISAVGGGDVTASGDNTFTGKNTFNKIVLSSDLDGVNGISLAGDGNASIYNAGNYLVLRKVNTITGGGGNLVLGDATVPTILRGSVVKTETNGKIYLNQGNVTAGDNVTITDTTDGIQISATGGGAAPVRYPVEVSDKSLMPSWYVVYNDGWCEQGGYSYPSTSTITFLKQFSDINYTLITQPCDKAATTGIASYMGTFKHTVTGFSAIANLNIAGYEWQASGYIK